MCPLVCVLLLAPAPAADDPPKPISILIEGPVDADMAPVAGRLTALFYQCYPPLLKRFENPTRPAPRQIKLVFDPSLAIPAHCSGGTVTVGVKWLRNHPDDVALLTHELTHAVQAYPRGEPGWLTEGIADYARQEYGPRDQGGWKLPERLTAKQSYKNSYRTTARFLAWADAKHPGVVDKLNRAMQEGKYDASVWNDATGKDVGSLWDECVKELAVKPAAP